MRHLRVPLLLNFVVSVVFAAEQPAARQGPAPQAASDIQQQQEFVRLDRVRESAAAGSADRAEAADQASRKAAEIAWELYRQKRWSDATAWLERQAALRHESFETWWKVLDADLARVVDALETTRATGTGWVELALLALDGTTNSRRANSTPDDPAARAQHRDDLRRGSVNLAMATVNVAVSENRTAAGLLANRHNDRERELAAANGAVEWARLWEPILKEKQPEAYRPVTLAAALETQGTVETKLGNSAAAREHLQEALAIRRAVPSSDLNRQVYGPLHKLALVEQELGNLDRARDLMNEALAEARRQRPVDPATAPIPDVFAHINGAHPWDIRLGLGSVLQAQGRYAEALEQMREAQQDARRIVETFEQLVKREPMLEPLMSLVAKLPLQARPSELLLRARIGDSTQARSDLRAVVREMTASGDSLSTIAAAVLLVRLASLDASQGRPQAALESLGVAQQYFITLNQTGPMVAASLALATVLEETGDQDEAVRHADTALRVSRQGKLGPQVALAATKVLRLQLSQGKNADVPALLGDIKANFGRLTFEEQAAALVVEGRIEEARGQPVSAAARYQEAVDRLELLRVDPLAQDGFFDAGARFEPYEHLIALAVKQGDAATALGHMYRSRRKELLQAHDPSNFSSTRPELQQPLLALRTLHARIRSLSATVARLRSSTGSDRSVLAQTEKDLLAAIGDWRTVGEAVAKVEPAYRAYVGDNPPSLRDVQRRLAARTALVIYTAPLDAELNILVITADAATFHRSPMAPKKVWETAGAALDAIGSARPTLDSALEPLTSLHGALIAPISSRLTGVDRLAILPTRRLHYLPFQALATRTAKGVRYLVEDKEIVLVSGAAIASLGREPRPSRSVALRLALFGNASGELTHAEDEVARIKQIFPSAATFTGTAATPEAVRAATPDATVLHFAVHGRLNPGLPASSYLELASTRNDGNLTVSEIRTLPLANTDLVTLSACVSSLGQGDPRGVAASSLSDAFLAAGAHSVVGTLWFVDDASSRDLMLEFYKALARGACKGSALRSAQLALLRRPSRSHPYYWSAFQLAGDSGGLGGQACAAPR